MNFAKAALAALAFGTMAAQPAMAQNKLNIVGTVNLFQVPVGAVGNVVVDFLAAGGGMGTVNSLTSFGIFSGIAPFTAGTQVDLAFGPVDPPPAGTPAPTPIGAVPGSPVLLMIGGFTFNTTFVFPGTVPGTPFNLFQSGPNVNADMSISGTVTGPGIMGTATFNGIYTTQFPSTTIPALIGQIEAGTVVPSSVSASFDVTLSAVPEPATVALMATGLLALGGIAVRRRNA